MCVIYACESSLPSIKELEQGAMCNPDGAGLAWAEGDKVNWIKGLKSNADTVLKLIKDKKIPFPLAIHFRSTSIGETSERMTHPFPLDPTANPDLLEGSHNKVLFQNGTWKDWDDVLRDVVLYNSHLKMPDGPWGDTRALAFLAYHKGVDILNFIGGDSRILVLNGDEDSSFWFWGKWEDHSKDGWWQSIDTSTQLNRIKWKGYDPRASMGDWEWNNDDYEEIAASRIAEANTKLTVVTPPSETIEGKLLDVSREYEEWSVDELHDLLMRAKEEIANARKSCDIYA